MRLLDCSTSASIQKHYIVSFLECARSLLISSLGISIEMRSFVEDRDRDWSGQAMVVDGDD